MRIFYFLLIVALGFIFINLFFSKAGNCSKFTNLPDINTSQKIVNFFPKSSVEIDELVTKTIQDAQDGLKCMLSINDSKRTYANTVFALDRVTANLGINSATIHVLSYVSPDENIRNSAQMAITKLQEFSINTFSQNQELYNTLKNYKVNLESKKFETLTREQTYFLKNLLDDFRKSGLEKPKEIQNQIKEIQKQLALLETEFGQNIYKDNRFITVELKDLYGLGNEFISSLKKTNNKYILTIDTPVYTKVLEDCAIESTRKALWQQYNQRGYPKNKEILESIIKSRDKLAKLLDYSSYAHMDIDNQMAKNPETIEKFLNDLIVRCQKKADVELNILKQDLPRSVKLVNSKFKPWDIAYTKNYYKKKYLNVDENLIKEYFPLDFTLPELFNIYQNFFGINFKKIEINNLWHETVSALEVYKDNKLIGTLLLDLYPRENKYNHACQSSIIPAVRLEKNKNLPALVLVIANFTKPNGQVSLLKRDEVITFFHECGHAIHALLGSRYHASLCGTAVKGDFVEMPSQMLEEWMWDRDVLKKITKHYKTGESMPDDLIEKIIKIKNFNSGCFTLGQIMYSLYSLNLFLDGENKNIDSLWHNLKESLLNYVISDECDLGYCSFGHLTGYGSKYYGYLWSKVYALDLFGEIKKHSLHSNSIGKIYAKKILCKGGSCEPLYLIENFLNREPSSDAFFEDLGLN